MQTSALAALPATYASATSTALHRAINRNMWALARIRPGPAQLVPLIWVRTFPSSSLSSDKALWSRLTDAFFQPRAGRSMLGMTDSIIRSTPRNAQMELSAHTPATKPAATQMMALRKSSTATAVMLPCQETRSSWLLFTKRPVTHSQLQYLVCTSPLLVGYLFSLALLPLLRTQLIRAW